MGMLFHATTYVPPTVTMASFDPAQAELYRINSQLSQFIADRNQYESSDEYMAIVQDLMMHRSVDVADSSIYLINRVDQVVGMLMQQYIMANPRIANLYDTGLITGFVYGHQPDSILPYTDRHNYSKVMDGIVDTSVEDDVNNITYYYTTDDDLELEEQLDIQNTWDFVLDRINQGLDPMEDRE